MPKRITDEQILEATIQVILEKGYTAATTRHIAKQADMSEMTLFRRYESKAKLTIAAVGYWVERDRLEVAYTGDVRADLLRVAEHYYLAGQAEGTKIIPLILLEVPRHPELREVVELPLAKVSRVGAMLTRYQEEGVLREEHPVHAVAGLIGPLIIMTLLRGVPLQRELPELELEALVDGFLSGRKQ